MAIEVLLPTSRTLGGTTRALLEALLGPGFQNIDRIESRCIEVEIMNVEGEEWAHQVPDEMQPEALGEALKKDRTQVRVRVALRLGCFLLFPGFVILSRPDDYAEYADDPRARQIIGREALELARAFGSHEIVVAGDAASDFLGSEVTQWDDLVPVLEEEGIEHELIRIPR